MASKVSVDKVLNDGSKIINAWTANSDFKLGDLTLGKFKSAHENLLIAHETVESRRTELTGLINDRDAQAHELNELVSASRPAGL